MSGDLLQSLEELGVAGAWWTHRPRRRDRAESERIAVERVLPAPRLQSARMLTLPPGRNSSV
jgi:hypothetical protein